MPGVSELDERDFQPKATVSGIHFWIAFKSNRRYIYTIATLPQIRKHSKCKASIRNSATVIDIGRILILSIFLGECHELVLFCFLPMEIPSFFLSISFVKLVFYLSFFVFNAYNNWKCV